MIIKGVTCDTVYIVLTAKLTNYLTDHLTSNLVTPFDSCLPMVTGYDIKSINKCQ